VKWMTVAVGFLMALVGREAWGWLPRLSAFVVRVETSILPSDRRDIRRREWQAELAVFEARRLTGLLWTLRLLPVCLFEAAKGERAEEVGTYVVWGGPLMFAYAFPFMYSVALVTVALDPFELSVVQNLAFIAFGPVVFCYLYCWTFGILALIGYCVRTTVGLLWAGLGNLRD
jgi:hypothetical protein